MNEPACHRCFRPSDDFSARLNSMSLTPIKGHVAQISQVGPVVGNPLAYNALATHFQQRGNKGRVIGPRMHALDEGGECLKEYIDSV